MALREVTAQPSRRTVLNTPSQPEYPCGHCVYAWTMATILYAGGPVAGGVDFTNEAMPGMRMNMPDFASYAKAVSQSRIDAGVHFRTTTEPSDAIGRQYGRIAMERFAPALK